MQLKTRHILAGIIVAAAVMALRLRRAPQARLDHTHYELRRSHYKLLSTDRAVPRDVNAIRNLFGWNKRGNSG
jgi:hypothetical protein